MANCVWKKGCFSASMHARRRDGRTVRRDVINLTASTFLPAGECVHSRSMHKQKQTKA